MRGSSIASSRQMWLQTKGRQALYPRSRERGNSSEIRGIVLIITSSGGSDGCSGGSGRRSTEVEFIDRVLFLIWRCRRRCSCCGFAGRRRRTGILRVGRCVALFCAVVALIEFVFAISIRGHGGRRGVRHSEGRRLLRAILRRLGCSSSGGRGGVGHRVRGGLRLFGRSRRRAR